MHLYYISYTYGTWLRRRVGCYHAQMESPIETYEDVISLADRIGSERRQSNVTIQDWKKLQ